jgi:hypothetical protein
MEIEDFETFDEKETASTISSRHRNDYQDSVNKLKRITLLTIKTTNLDSYFAKRKDLKEKHIGALLKLINA